MSFYLFGVSLWATVAAVMLGSAVFAALASLITARIQRALGREMERMRESYEHVSAAFHEPLPSSPSHPSYPPPRR